MGDQMDKTSDHDQGNPPSRSPRPKRKGRAATRAPNAPQTKGVMGGQYAPLDDHTMAAIDDAAQKVLIDIGFADAPQEAIDLVLEGGGRLTDQGRLCMTAPMIAEALADLARPLVLYGREDGLELHLEGARVHAGTGGAAPLIFDDQQNHYRPTSLRDIYAAARLVDGLDHIHFFNRPMVARDMPDDHSLDLNTAYASIAGTKKPIATSIAHPDTVDDVARILEIVAGSMPAFQEKPFLSLNINHVTPPLRLAPDAVLVMIKAARLGIPIHANTFGQVGASSPVDPMGALVQTVAETLGGMIIAWLANPSAKVIFGARPMITDLRTGAMSGGGGEQARIMAATSQMARYYGLPNSSIAGATDSKIPDAQSGFEKSMSVLLAAQAGSNMITQAAGMQAALMGCALESYIIDNDMIGAILRTLDMPSSLDTAPVLDALRDVVEGDGHFLGHADTLDRMQSDYLYPKLADRDSIEQWQDNGMTSILDRARADLNKRFDGRRDGDGLILIDDDKDVAIRAEFDIRLDR